MILNRHMDTLNESSISSEITGLTAKEVETRIQEGAVNIDAGV